MANSRKSPSIECATAALRAAVAHCLARHVLPGQYIAVALSGGIDSVCLLHVLATQLRQDAGLRGLTALHVHHGLSPHADRWSAFCERLCAQYEIPCRISLVAVEGIGASGLEGAARRARHAVFAAAPEDWVMLAHHRDDQAETLLFNLLRGAGIAGAAAMRERNGRLLRPWLSIGRAEIVCYAQHHQLDWCEDESNADIGLSRNYLRRRIFPALTERFPAAAANFAKAAAHFAESKDLLDDLARLDLTAAQPDFPVSISRLAGLSEPRRRNVLRYLLAINNVQIPSEAKLQEAVQQMLTAAPDRHPFIHFGRHCLRRRRGYICLESPAECADNS